MNKWAADFVAGLQNIRRRNDVLGRKLIGADLKAYFRTVYAKALHRLIMLDYDGTLVGFAEEPQEALPHTEVYEVLEALVGDSRIKL